MNNAGQSKARHKDNKLPLLNETIIESCAQASLSFMELYALLSDSDPCAAQWLRDQTEYLAPANPAEKEKYAILALKLYYMLQASSR